MSKERKWDHAIVIGGSIGGLLAARALADYFKRVTILERDVFPEDPVTRKTVPQGNHIHVLLNEGQTIVENLFPGIIREMTEAGANWIDSAQDFSWFFQGSWRPRHKSKNRFLLTFRPYVDWHIRRRLFQDCPNVKALENAVAENLLSNPEKNRVTGVRFTENGGPAQELEADLVVDSSGRTSKTPDWLEQMGYSRPREKEIGIELAYTSRIYKRPERFQEDWKFLVLYPQFPSNWRAGFISSIQNDQWIVSLNGYFDDHAPTSDAGFLEFAKSLPKPDIYNWIKDEKPLTEAKIYKIPRIRRRYYEKLSRFPDGLIVIGDANCVFNPIFGQGMTAVSLYVKALRNMLAKRLHNSTDDLQGFSRAFQKSLKSSLDLPWFLTNMVDLSYPQTKGPRPPGMRLISWFLARTLEALSRNPRLSETFLDVLHLHGGLGKLINPFFSMPILAHGIKAFFVPLEKRAETREMPSIRDAGETGAATR